MKGKEVGKGSRGEGIPRDVYHVQAAEVKTREGSSAEDQGEPTGSPRGTDKCVKSDF